MAPLAFSFRTPARACAAPLVISGLIALLACSGGQTAQPAASAGANATGSAGLSGGGASASSAGTANAGTGTANAGASSGGSETAGSGGAAAGIGGTTAGGSAGAGGAAGGSGAGVFATATAKIMVVGSSNEVITCWRAFLWQKLQAAQIKNFDFVGGVTDGPDCGVAGYDKDLQAMSGIIISNLPASTYQGWFSAHPPDIILMHFGGADLLNNMPVDGVLKAYSLALAEARKVNPKVYLFIAQHTPQDSNGCAACDASVLELNADIVTWAAANTTAASPVAPVDLYSDIVPAMDLSDGVHLNEAGSQKVSDRWLTALTPLFKP